MGYSQGAFLSSGGYLLLAHVGYSQWIFLSIGGGSSLQRNVAVKRISCPSILPIGQGQSWDWFLLVENLASSFRIGTFRLVQLQKLKSVSTYE